MVIITSNVKGSSIFFDILLVAWFMRLRVSFLSGKVRYNFVINKYDDMRLSSFLQVARFDVVDLNV